MVYLRLEYGPQLLSKGFPVRDDDVVPNNLAQENQVILGQPRNTNLNKIILTSESQIIFSQT